MTGRSGSDGCSGMEDGTADGVDGAGVPDGVGVAGTGSVGGGVG